MIWLQPAAWLGLAALVAPLLIHLLVHRRSEPLAFPTLRFLRPTRLASLRRHRLDDVALLLVRATILTLAVAALAGPLLLTTARQASWNSRVVRVLIVDPAAPGRSERLARARQEAARAYRSTIIEAADPAEGLRRAVAWLNQAPPARREIVSVAAFAIGAVTEADVQAVPADIGLRFIRGGALPPTRSLPATPVLAWADTQAGNRADTQVGLYVRGVGADLSVRPMIARHRTITLAGERTSVRNAGGTSSAALPIEIAASPGDMATVDAALDAVIQQGAPAPAAGRTARLVIGGAPGALRIRSSGETIHTPWIGDAVARITQDRDVVSSANEISIPADAIPWSAPWQAIAIAANGAPILSAAQAGDRLIVFSGAAAADLLTPVLIRSILDALAPPMDERAAEIVPIAEAQLRAWERPAGPARRPHRRPVQSDIDDDARWLWAAALGLIGVEAWMRRRGQQQNESAGAEVADRVA
jgi:hypothetical protein